MRLHTLIEELRASRAIDDAQTTLLETIYPAVKQFDFGDLTDVPEKEWQDLQDFAFDLIIADKFQLPFDNISYSYVLDGAQYIVIAGLRGRKFIETFCASRILDKMIFQVGVFDLESSRSERKYNGICIKSYPSTVDHLKNEHLAGLMEGHVKNLCALTTMMKASGVEISVEPEPTKLNVKRAIKLRLPIQEIRTVTVRVGGQRYSLSGKQLGAHASPRLHWRRGHIRHLPSGEITTVSPCLVGNVGSEPLSRDYAVKRKPQERQ